MAKPKNNLGLTEENVSDLFHEEVVYDDKDNIIFEPVSKKFFSNDSEKSHVEYTVVIKDVKTGKFWKTILGQSPWYMQSEHNANQKWTEAKPKKKTTISYE